MPPPAVERVNLLNKSGFSLEQGVAVDGAENTGLTLALAGMGNRMLAFLLDSLITSLLSIAVVVLFSLVGLLSGSETAIYYIYALLLLALFVIHWGYFITFELIWHGQTPGKRLLRIKVVREDGRPVNFTASFLRNILRTVDVLPGGYALGLIMIFVNAREKRIGDIVGGTMVVKEPVAAFPARQVRSSSLAALPRGDNLELVRLSRHLTTEEMELIGDYLQRRHSLEQETRVRLGEKLAEKLARRLNIDQPDDADKFLEHLGAIAFHGGWQKV